MKFIFIISLFTLLSCPHARRLRKNKDFVTLTQEKKIGKGNFGTVYALTSSQSDLDISDFVVKVVKFSTEPDKENSTKQIERTPEEEKIYKENLIFSYQSFKSSVSSFVQETKILIHLTDFEFKGTVNQVIDNTKPFSFTLEKSNIEQFKDVQQKPVTTLLYAYFNTEKGFLVMPKYTDLFDEFEKVFGRISSAGYFNLFLEIAEAIKYVHSKNVVIKDLKLENMLLRKSLKLREKQVLEGKEPWGVVLSDFGLSCLIEDNYESQSCLEQRSGTPYYVSIDQLHDPARTTPKSDVFTLARVIVWAVDPRMIEIEDFSELLDNHEAVRTKLQNKATKFVPELENLLFKMLEVNPEHRITIDNFISDFKIIGQNSNKQILKKNTDGKTKEKSCLKLH